MPHYKDHDLASVDHPDVDIPSLGWGQDGYVVTWDEASGKLIAAPATGIEGPFVLGGILTPPSITSDQDNYHPNGLETASVLRLSTGSSTIAQYVTTVIPAPLGNTIAVAPYRNTLIPSTLDHKTSIAYRDSTIPTALGNTVARVPYRNVLIPAALGVGDTIVLSPYRNGVIPAA